MTTKKKFNKALIRNIIILLVCVLIAGYIGNWIGYDQGHWDLFKEREISPSGNYVFERAYGLKESIGLSPPSLIRYKRFVIVPVGYRNRDGGLVDEYVCEITFSLRFKSISGWGKEDTFWVHSSDIGTSYWEIEDGEWRYKIPDENSIFLAPEEMIEIWRERGYID